MSPNSWLILENQKFKCQYTVAGEICDILALGKSNNLVIIELKNNEDRYLIPQCVQRNASVALALLTPPTKIEPSADTPQKCHLIV